MSRSKRITLTPELQKDIARAITDNVTALRLTRLRNSSSVPRDNELIELNRLLVKEVFACLQSEKETKNK